MINKIWLISLEKESIEYIFWSYDSKFCKLIQHYIAQHIKLGFNMTKTITIENDTHELIIKKQKEIIDTKGIKIQIKDIIGRLVKDHIDNFNT